MSLSLQTNQVDISYKLQLAFMQKFTNFIKWPNDISENFVIGIYGDSPFGGVESKFYEGIFAKGKPIKVIKTYNLNALKDANIIYVCNSKFGEIPLIKDWSANKNALIVANKTNAASKGVMINFYEIDDKMRFEINYDVLQNANFKISSKLLKLARIVE